MLFSLSFNFDFEARKKLFNNYLNYVPKLNEEFCASFNNFKDFTNFLLERFQYLFKQ